MIKTFKAFWGVTNHCGSSGHIWGFVMPKVLRYSALESETIMERGSRRLTTTPGTCPKGGIIDGRSQLDINYERLRREQTILGIAVTSGRRWKVLRLRGGAKRGAESLGAGIRPPFGTDSSYRRKQMSLRSLSQPKNQSHFLLLQLPNVTDDDDAALDGKFSKI